MRHWERSDVQLTLMQQPLLDGVEPNISGAAFDRDTGLTEAPVC